jgi:predicted nucleotidyltransferase
MDKKMRDLLTKLRQGLEDLYGERLVELVLFGSQARGDATPDSDVDVLVVLKGNVSPAKEIKQTGVLMAALSLEADVVISCVFISEERYRREQSPLLLNVRREGMAVP